MFNNLRSALFASFVATAIACLIITFFLMIAPINKMVLGQTQTQILKQLSLASKDYVSLLENGADKRTLQKAAQRTASYTAERITVIGGNGKVLADSDLTMAQVDKLENHLYRPEVQEAIRTGKGSAVRYSSTQKRDYIYVALALKYGAGKTVFLRFSVPKTYAYEQDIVMLSPFAIAAIFAVIISIILSVIFSSSFARPIARLSEAAKQITKGKFPQYISRGSKFEIGELEKDLEEMSGQLSQTFSYINSEKDRINAILSSMIEGVLAVDEKGDVILMNESARRMLAVNEDITGQNAIEKIRNSDITGMIKSPDKESFSGSKEIKLYMPDEKTLLLQMSRIETGGTVFVLHDITNLKKLEKIRSEFGANVSHELKTPLTSIKAAVETLLSGAIDDKPHAVDFLNRIHKNTDRLSLLIDDVMELSELETRKIADQGAFTNIHELFDRSIEVLSSKIAEKNIKVDMSGLDRSIQLVCSEEHLMRVIVNLLDNAVKYNKVNGTIFVSSSIEGDFVRISIKDTGIGIDEHHLPRIFERFYTVDKSRSRELGGTGLGLAIVKHIIELYGGTIQVVSSPNEGSTFSFTLKKA
jgi:two-component system, OmpR family, phosphate regulon sensor histidine kinase PhoR